MSPSEVAVILIAKAPEPGRVKTRLSPPCTPAQAAALAEAALCDTIDAVNAALLPGRRVLALDGSLGPWPVEGWDVVTQRGDGLAERLAAAFDDTGGPAFLVGMDTPQLTADLVDDAIGRLTAYAGASVLGGAEDGGWWGLGLPAPDPEVFVGVPMSRDDTGARQRSRLMERGYRVVDLPALRDVDTWADAARVAALAPRTRFAARVADVERVLA